MYAAAEASSKRADLNAPKMLRTVAFFRIEPTLMMKMSRFIKNTINQNK
jgi:hypothetical protein